MGEIERGAGGRPGAPWGELKGPTSAVNDLAKTLREWLDASGLRVKDFHAKLQPIDFGEGRVPSLDTVYNRFAGGNLDWYFVSAVVQICSADAVTVNKRLKEAQGLWSKVAAAERARRETRRAARRANPPVVEVPAALTAADNLSADQRLIATYDKIGQMYEAQAALKETNHRLELLVVLALGKEKDYVHQIADLERQLEAALANQAPDPARIAAYEVMIEDVRAREAEMALARYEAEDDRDVAQQMLGHANQEIAGLKTEIDRLKSVFGLSAQRTVERVGDILGDGLQGVDGAIGAIQQILDEEHDQLRRLRESLGWRLVGDEEPARPGGRTIVGEVVHPVDDTAPTTPDNPPTSQNALLERPVDPTMRPDDPVAGRTGVYQGPDNPTTGQVAVPERPDNPTTRPDNPTVPFAQRVRETAATGNEYAQAALRRLPRLLGIAITISWAIIVGSAFTEIRRGPASLLGMVFSALAGLTLLGCFQLWVRKVVSRGMTRESDFMFDSLFIGTTTRRVTHYHVRTPTFFQTVGLLPALIAPDYLGPLNTLGQGIAHLVGMA
ncbi:hypothetical protein [Kitasatospora sp. NPDC050543]|uniref:hypothetical protein n=1 Tax=Kitasatospora sp. NPDC050543 TaxID=3364054 RepID=UPI00379E1A46